MKDNSQYLDFFCEQSEINGRNNSCINVLYKCINVVD